MYNQFLGGIGPRPATAQPMLEDPNQEMFDWSAGNMDQEAAIHDGISDIIRQQMAGTREEARGLAYKGAGMGAKQAFPQIGGAIRGAADYAMAPVKAGVKAAQNYVTGGPTTQAAGQAAAQSGFSVGELMAQSQPYLGAAGVAYNTYQGIDKGIKSSGDLRRALRSDTLSSDQEDDLRESAMKAGVRSSQTGAASGAASGFSVAGPPGAAVGGALGSVGGQLQAWNAAKGSRGSDLKNFGQAEMEGAVDTVNAPTNWLARSTNAPSIRGLGAAPEPENVAFWNAKNFSDRAKKASNAGKKAGDLFGVGGFGGGSMF